MQSNGRLFAVSSGPFPGKSLLPSRTLAVGLQRSAAAVHCLCCVHQSGPCVTEPGPVGSLEVSDGKLRFRPPSRPLSELGSSMLVLNTVLGGWYCSLGCSKSLQGLHALCHKLVGGPGVCGVACTFTCMLLYPSEGSALHGTELNHPQSLQWKRDHKFSCACTASVLARRECFWGKQDFGRRCVAYPVAALCWANAVPDMS